MEFSPLAFWMISSLIIISAIGMIFSRVLIYSALLMVFCFMGVAGIYILLHAELVAAAQVLIYVGAISILVIFAIMLTRHRWGDFRMFFHRQSLIALPIAVIAGIVLIAFLATASYNSAGTGLNPDDETIAKLIFTEYAYPFEIVSLVLLVAMVGAILLARKEKR